MTIFQAIVLALVQAVTEFLPVSSSGHLILIPRLLKWPDQGLEFDIATNSGTLLAVLAYFRREIADMARAVVASLGRRVPGVTPDRAPDARLFWLLVVATIPAGVAGLLLKHWIAGSARDPRLIAATAIFYGALLLFADRSRAGSGTSDGKEIEALTLGAALLIGCAQALALVPGTSRSGVTITAALLLGFARPAAARFAFLLAIPIGLLLAAKQVFDCLRGEPLGVEPELLAIGIGVSAVAGYAVISFLLGWVRRRSLAPFALYRIGLGVLLLLLFAR
ncbi:MAG: undecaprenyl-diphosphate phosphatase [Thermoanaerobaculia bacterium]